MTVESTGDHVKQGSSTAFTWVIFSGVALVTMLVLANPSSLCAQAPQQNLQPQVANQQEKVYRPGDTDFDQELAFEHLLKICKIGTRVSTSKGMIKQQKYIEKHFKSLGLKVEYQEFKAKSPYNGRMSKLKNMIVRLHPKRKKRLLFCCHYDTRPYADMDLVNPKAKFIGANDGASGVGLLCELARHLVKLDGPYGFDLVFFDGEEFVIQRRVDDMFLGSTHFAEVYAQQVAQKKIDWKYDYGILVDMVADKDLQIFFESNTLGFPHGKRLSESIWGVARQLGVKEFIPQQKHQIRDDHLPLNQIGGIPVCDIIDFDFPNPQRGNAYWHTRDDNPKNCSADSLGKVGSVLLEWTRQMQAIHQGK